MNGLEYVSNPALCDCKLGGRYFELEGGCTFGPFENDRWPVLQPAPVQRYEGNPVAGDSPDSSSDSSSTETIALSVLGGVTFLLAAGATIAVAMLWMARRRPNYEFF